MIRRPAPVVPRPMARAGLTAVAAVTVLFGVAAPGAGQEVRTAVAGDSIRVGDVVPVAVRITVDRGERVAWPDTLPLGDAGGDVENAARVRERVDTLGDGRLQVTGVYSVTPWRVGETTLPEVPIRVVSGDERARTVTARLPALRVATVLPADTAGLDPKPAKGVIGANWTWWSLLILLAVIGLLILAILWWRRRRARRRKAIPARPPIPPQEAALAALQAARDAGYIERGEMKELYTRIAAAVRDYLEAVEPVWSGDLTTTELLARVRAGAGTAEAAGVAEVLRPADQVKFARRRPDATTAVAEWEAARRWVAGFTWPPPAAEPDQEAA